MHEQNPFYDLLNCHYFAEALNDKPLQSVGEGLISTNQMNAVCDPEHMMTMEYETEMKPRDLMEEINRVSSREKPSS